LSAEVVERNTEVARALVDAYRKLKRMDVEVPERLRVVFGLPRFHACGFYNWQRGEVTVGTFTPECNPIFVLLHEVRHHQQYLKGGGELFKRELGKPWTQRSHEVDANYWARENLKLLAEELRRVSRWMERGGLEVEAR